jgi:hypothetical protein
MVTLLHHQLFVLFVFKIIRIPFSSGLYLRSPIRAFIMSDNQIIKAEKDFSKDADKLIPEAETLAQVHCGDDVAWICVLISIHSDQSPRCHRQAACLGEANTPS